MFTASALTYQPIFSNYQYASARNLRQSPIHHRLAAAGAVFGGVKGYERPLYFMQPTDPYEDITFPVSWLCRVRGRVVTDAHWNGGWSGWVRVPMLGFEYESQRTRVLSLGF